MQKFAMAQFGAVVVRLREPCCVADVFDDFVEGGSLLGSPEGDGFFAQLHIVHLEIVVGLVLIQGDPPLLDGNDWPGWWTTWHSTTV